MLSPCSICPNKNSPEWIVPGDGPTPCDILFVGEKPGRDEHSQQRPFVGRTGREFNTRLLQRTLSRHRDTVRVTNAVHCYGDGRNPTEEEARICSEHHLRKELERTNPLTVVLMGSVACSLVSDISLDIHHGIYREDTELLGWKGTVFPVIHPSAGLHQSRLMKQISEDFEALYDYLHGGRRKKVDLFKNTNYQVWNPKRHIPITGFHGPYYCIAIDTELDSNTNGKPWCLTFSPMVGVAYMVKADNPHDVGEFRRHLYHHLSQGCRVLLHNALFDLKVLREGFNIIIPPENLVDTMILAYHRGLPQGLKALAYRLCGMEMQDYNDLVTPYSEMVALDWVLDRQTQTLEELDDIEKEMLDWLTDAYDMVDTENWPAPTARAHTPAKRLQKILDDYATGKNRDLFSRYGKLPEDLRRTIEDRTVPVLPNPAAPKALLTKINRLVSDRQKSETVNVWDRLSKWDEPNLGPLPDKSLLHVPFAEALHYACRDADATYRIYQEILKHKITCKEEDADEY